jgi:hypothetical protein
MGGRGEFPRKLAEADRCDKRCTKGLSRDLGIARTNSSEESRYLGFTTGLSFSGSKLSSQMLRSNSVWSRRIQPRSQ